MSVTIWIYLLLTSGVFVLETNSQTFQVRLVGGTNSSNGRVEVSNGLEWGTVCDDKWEDQDATVVCRMLSYSRGIALVSENGVPPFGAGTVPIVLDDVTCFGPERNLGQCPHRGWGVHGCDHTEDAGVQCVGSNGNSGGTASTSRPVTPGQVPDNCPGNQPSPDIRLYGTTPGIGIVEVFEPTANQWGSVCDDAFGQREAIVVCRMLCYDIQHARPGASDDAVRANPRLPIRLDNVDCTGNENSISACTSNGWNNENCNDTTEAVRVTCVPQNYLAPPPPIPTVTCTNSVLLATFNRTNYPEIEDKHLSVRNNPPNCNVLRQTTTTVAQIAIPYDECDTVRELNATHIVYKNTVQIASTYLQNNVIKRNIYLIYIACDFPRSGDVDDNGIQPLTESVSQRAPGQYNFQMRFYRFDNLSEPVTQFPVRINLGEFLNVGISLEDIDTGLKLIVPNCRASPTLDPNSNENYPLIADRCPSDPALATFPWNRTTFAFRFQTFKFVGNSPVFFVNCDTFVCTIDEKNADCDQTCPQASLTGKRRRKRSVDRVMYHVGGGPFQILSTDSPQIPPVIVKPITTTSPSYHSPSPHPESPSLPPSTSTVTTTSVTSTRPHSTKATDTKPMLQNTTTVTTTSVRSPKTHVPTSRSISTTSTSNKPTTTSLFVTRTQTTHGRVLSSQTSDVRTDLVPSLTKGAAGNIIIVSHPSSKAVTWPPTSGRRRPSKAALDESFTNSPPQGQVRLQDVVGTLSGAGALTCLIQNVFLVVLVKCFLITT